MRWGMKPKLPEKGNLNGSGICLFNELMAINFALDRG
jgi:hypothetical protein